MKILITGATGLVGQELGIELVRQGHQLIVISREASRAKAHLPFPCEVIEGDLSKSVIRDSRFDGLDAVYHLMGESVAGARWSANQKEKILQSRVLSTQNLIQSLSSASLAKNFSFISASAIGYYGDRGDEFLTEDSAAGSGFLSEVCQKWESAAFAAQDLSVKSRVITMRLGVVLSARGGALEKMRLPFELKAGTPLGHGRQGMSWIHLQDVVGLAIFVLQNERVQGAVNFVSPGCVSNLKFSEQLAESLKTHLLPVGVPAVVMKAALGEMSEVVLASQFVRSNKCQGYQFRYPTLAAALHECCDYFLNAEQVFFARQYFALEPAELFTFFAEAKNLEKITPEFLNFKIESMSTPEIQLGTKIIYQLKVHGVPVKWKTQIQEWTPPVQFVDNQESGPYRKWHHTHTFEKLGEGTLMSDVVRYQLPLKTLGQLAAGWFVRGDVEKIFAYRRSACSRLLAR